MQKLSTFLLIAAFFSITSVLYSQTEQLVKPGSPESIKNVPITISNQEAVTFSDNFNGTNTVAALEARGWVVLNVDGGGTTAPFYQGSTPFPAYEGPDTGYVAANYNGANGLLIDQWLISPPINVNVGDTLSFWHRSIDANPYDDSIYVRYSTTAGITPAAFNVNWGRFLVNESGWARWTGTFNHTGTVRFAIQYYHTNGGPSGLYSNYIGIDFLSVTTTVVPPIFSENFDSYTNGNLVACSNPTFWTTWSNAPCGAEDALVSNEFSRSTPHSAKIIQNDDLVKKFGTLAYTTGKYKIKFYAYIPATKAGYFNTLATFAGSNSSWGMECYFDAGGNGRVFGGSATAVPFTWTAGVWFPVEHIVDLTANQSQVFINGNLIHTWQWTLGASGTGCPLTLDANDFFGATANDIMYIDDYSLEDLNVIPVELSAFTGVSNNGNVVLNWTTESELNNQGFEVQKKSGDSEFATVGFVNGNGTTTDRKLYSFTDSEVEAGTYYYRLKQIDFNGVYEYSSEIVVEVIPSAPLSFSLDQNYPNPFNPTTSISFSLAEPTFVKLAIYNLLGQEVEVLKNEHMNAGSYNVNFDASSFTSGMYLYKIETAQFVSVRKMMLMK